MQILIYVVLILQLKKGELYNIDGNGNRVAAMIFGPKEVIVSCWYK